MNNQTDQLSHPTTEPAFKARRRQLAGYSLRTKLILALVGVGILSAGVVALLANFITQKQLTDQANQSLLTAAEQTAATIDAFIEINQNIIEAEAQLPDLKAYLSLPPEQRQGTEEEEHVAEILSALSRRDPFISSYALLDSRGINMLDTFSLDIGKDKSNEDYFQIPFQTGHFYVSPVSYFATIPRELGFNFSSPVRTDTGKIIGVLRVRYTAGILQQFVFEKPLAGPESFAILLDENQVRLAHGTRVDLILKSVLPLPPEEAQKLQDAGRLSYLPLSEVSTNLPDLAAGLARVGTDEPFFTMAVAAVEGDMASAAVVSLKGRNSPPWLVVFAQPQQVFLAPARTQTQILLLSVAIIVVGITGLAFNLGNRVGGPIVRLTAVAQRVAGGDLTAQAPVESQDETGQLAKTFNSMTVQLRDLIGSLEDQVHERTAELALSIEVGQRAAAIRELGELLPTITEFIREQFSLYYAQVYFVDDLGQNLILRAGTGEVGRELLAHHHSLPVGTGSIVGRVAAERKSIVVPDTRISDLHKANPLLPETRSELAIPLLLEGRAIGVLDMQANEVNTFTENSLTVFEAMATQLAISIDSAQQWALAQEAQQKSEEAIRQLTRQSWAERLTSRQENLGFVYDLSTVAPISGLGFQTGHQTGVDFGLAAAEEESKIENQKSKTENHLSVPVVVQNQPIGQLAVEVPAERTMSPDEQDLLAAVAQRLAQKAENLRLFEQTQQRAAREQIARQIVDKVRGSRDIETALRTAAEELSKALAVSRAMIDLKVTQSDEPERQ